MFAVNLGDLVQDSLDHRMAQMLVAPVRGDVITAEPGRVDGFAVLLACDDTRAQAIVDVIRLKFAKSALRCYTNAGKTGKPTKTWRRI